MNKLDDSGYYEVMRQVRAFLAASCDSDLKRFAYKAVLCLGDVNLYINAAVKSPKIIRKPAKKLGHANADQAWVEYTRWCCMNSIVYMHEEVKIAIAKTLMCLMKRKNTLHSDDNVCNDKELCKVLKACREGDIVRACKQSLHIVMRAANMAFSDAFDEYLLNWAKAIQVLRNKFVHCQGVYRPTNGDPSVLEIAYKAKSRAVSETARLVLSKDERWECDIIQVGEFMGMYLDILLCVIDAVSELCVEDESSDS